MRACGMDEPGPPQDVDAPVALDLEGYLTDPQAELRRCAEQSWCAHAIDERGEPLAHSPPTVQIVAAGSSAKISAVETMPAP